MRSRAAIVFSRMAGAAALCLLVIADAQADFWDGFIAYRRGDYEIARTEWVPLAEQGHVDAQFFLGAMYFFGEGVPQDDHQAAVWFRLAAEQGHAPAQYHLGIMYRTGEGVRQNFVTSLMWLNLAAAQDYQPAIDARELVARNMTPGQKETADDMARQWQADHP
jgi:hypothetical protein